MSLMRMPSRRLAAPLAALALLAACGTDTGDDVADSTGTPTASASTSAPATDSASPSETASETAAAETAVPTYFAGDTPQGTRLYREFHQVTGDPADAALAALGTDPLDPDYYTLLPSGELHVSGTDPVTVDLPDAGWAELPPGGKAADAKLAIQQVVRTVQGVLQSDAPVTFALDGQPAATVLGQEQPADGFKATENSLALVNVTTPEEGQQVSGAITAEGVANSFEATVPWEVRDESGKKVLDGFATAEGWADKLYPWSTQVDLSSLAPGTYTFVAMTDDASEGEGGGPTEDTKTIIVG
jgi:hypothetical protein